MPRIPRHPARGPAGESPRSPAWLEGVLLAAGALLSLGLVAHHLASS